MQKTFLTAILAFFAMFMQAENEESLNFDYVYAQGTYRVIGVKVESIGGAYGKIVIPERMWDYPVIEIGEDAFQSSDNITSVVFPSTITKVGARAFKNCTNLTDVDFGHSLQIIEEDAFSGCLTLKSITLPNTTKEIHKQGFWSCPQLEYAHLGNSLTSIGDYAFQFCFSLKSISLPNTLTSVGDHFLCSCKGLETIVIPENLISIGDHFLHGCENMKKVYLMGDKERTLGAYPFISQYEQNLKQISNCVFYVESEEVYNKYYKNADNWKYADESNRELIVNIEEKYQNGGNRYEWNSRPDAIRPYEPQWITVCYPTDIDYKAVFGDQALLAEMTSAQYKGTDASGEHLYHIDFTLVDSELLKANTPYLLKVDPKNQGSAFIVDHPANLTTKPDSELSKTIDISNQSEDTSAAFTQIKMLGTYTQEGRNLQPGEFLFYNNKGDMRFYKQLKKGKQRTVGAYRCYWQIIKDNEVVPNAKLGVLDMETTGIKAEVHIHKGNHTEVFNLRGELVNPKWSKGDNLPAGTYIIDGKKVMIK